jgi:hypothetical protein
VNRTLSGLAGALLAAAVSSAAFGATEPQNAAKGEKAALSTIEFASIAVETSSEDSNFTVIDSRFDETATAGAFLGVLGASVNSGINAGEDNKKADRFREAAAKIDLAGLISKSASDRLAVRANPPLAASKADASHVLVIELRNWGLIRADRDDPRLRTFLNLSWKIVDQKGATVFEKKRENAVSPTLRALEEVNDQVLTTEMETLASKAGQQIAYQIIYR